MLIIAINYFQEHMEICKNYVPGHKTNPNKFRRIGIM